VVNPLRWPDLIVEGQGLMLLSFLEVVTGFGGGWSQVSGLYPNQLSEAYPLSFFLSLSLIRGENGTRFHTA